MSTHRGQLQHYHNVHCAICNDLFHPHALAPSDGRWLCDDCVAIDRMVRALPHPAAE
jgi:hypothetical protein